MKETKKIRKIERDHAVQQIRRWARHLKYIVADGYIEGPILDTSDQYEQPSAHEVFFKKGK